MPFIRCAREWLPWLPELLVAVRGPAYLVPSVTIPGVGPFLQSVSLPLGQGLCLATCVCATPSPTPLVGPCFPGRWASRLEPGPGPVGVAAAAPGSPCVLASNGGR